MPTSKEIRPIIQNILQSKDFKDSPVYKNLLIYLVDASLSKTIPKEVTIAIDIFGKDSNYNSYKDSTVRYHVHMLRKKLENYYKFEGKYDKTKLIIPKGHYEIQFISSQAHSPKFYDRIVLSLKRWYVPVIVFLVLLNIYFIYHQLFLNKGSTILQDQNYIDSDDKIWGSFFENHYPIIIILGDDFQLDEYSPEYQRYRQIRDWEIDSENDLYNFLLKYPQAKLWKSEISGIPFGGVTNLMDILPIVYQFQSDVSLSMSSTLSLDKIRNHNIIYMGEFKNLRVLNKIIFKTPIRYQYQPDERLFIVDEHDDTLNTFLRIEAPYEQKDKYNVDYSLLIKIPGFSNENFMFVVGFGYGGRLERTKILGDPQLRAGFVEQIHHINSRVPEYFIALFEVKSIERTGFTNELKYFKEISPEFFE